MRPDLVTGSRSKSGAPALGDKQILRQHNVEFLFCSEFWVWRIEVLQVFVSWTALLRIAACRSSAAFSCRTHHVTFFLLSWIWWTQHIQHKSAAADSVDQAEVGLPVSSVVYTQLCILLPDLGLVMSSILGTTATLIRISNDSSIFSMRNLVKGNWM